MFRQYFLFSTCPYHDFDVLVIFQGRIGRKIRKELGFEFHDTRRSDPRNAAPPEKLRKDFPSRWASKELSLSRSGRSQKKTRGIV